jgi:hypothetical protein
MTEAQGSMAVPPGDVAAAEFAKNTRAFRNGANWFYWIAGLSIVNSLVSLAQGTLGFIVGLGVTQVVDAIARAILAENTEAAGMVRIIALGASVFFAGFFALFGWLANRGQGWALLVGMVLYLLDGLLFVLVQDWLSLAFHGFALYCMFQGYTALRRLKALVPPTSAQPAAFGPNI